jgi:hypothetical protein
MEVVWDIKVVGSAVRRERCTKRRARSAKKNAKFLLSPERTVPYIARIVSPSEKTQAVNIVE